SCVIFRFSFHLSIMALDLKVSVPLIFLHIRIQHQTTAKIWTDAQSYCRQNYTDLPTIHNSEQNNQINQILLSGYYIWIGLFLDSWEWSDKWSLFFRHWAAGQPSQSSGSGDYAKFIKKQIIRLKLSCYGKCTLNDPSLQMAILNEVCICLKQPF
uniref:C-type lectin domain-containing protein n=1 Tax=Cyprinus carpio TaxID=7962 RepID=A0A8C2A671_CYPCA